MQENEKRRGMLQCCESTKCTISHIRIVYDVDSKCTCVPMLFCFSTFFFVSFSLLCSVLFKRKKILTRSKCSQDKNWEIFVDVVCAGVFYFLKKNFFSISRFAVSVSLQFECVIVCSISSNIFLALKGALLRNDNVLLIHVLCDIDDNFEAFSHRNLMFTRWQ